MSWMDNLRIRSKLLVGLSVSALGMLILVASGVFLSATVSGSLRDLNGVAFERFQRASETEARFAGFHAELYRLTSFAANNRDAATLSALAERLSMALKALREQVGEPASSDVLSYLDSAKDVIEMAPVSPSIALSAMNRAEKRFEKIREHTRSATADADRDRRAAFDDALETLTRGGFSLAVVALAVIAVSTGATLLAGRAIARPIGALTSAMTALASGDLGAEVPHLSRMDEVGAMAKAVLVFKQGGIERARLEAERTEATERMRIRSQSMETVSRDFQAAIADVLARLTTTVSQLADMAGTLHDAADRTNQQVEVSIRGAGVASENVNAVAAASEQMSCAAVQMAERAEQSRGFIQGAVAEVGQTRQLVDDLVSASDRITEIVGLISTIAKKTNLLALNASIEAARAGDSGKGFAVVAGEVKALANQTERATGEICQQVETVQRVARATADAITAITDVIGAVDGRSQEISQVIQEQHAVIQGVSDNATEAARGTDAVVDVAHDIKALASNTNNRSAELAAMVQELEGEVRGIRECIGGFLGTMQDIA